MVNQRIPMGIPGLDEILLGGLIPQRTYLLVGASGTGKTILSIQFMLEGKRRNERTLYLTLNEPAGEIRRNMASFGWTLEGVEMVDLAPTGEEEAVVSKYQVFAPSEVDENRVWNTLYDVIQAKRPQRLVIDTVTELRLLSVDEYQFRAKMLSLVRFLNQSGCTSLVVFESRDLDQELAVTLAVDGVLRLRSEISTSRVIELRSLQIQKYRGSDYISGLHPLRIGPDGIEVYPHRIEPSRAKPPVGVVLKTGVPQLDEVVGGGIELGTTTIISGPSGVGKTSLGVLFLKAALALGQRAVLFMFEESVEVLKERCRGIGMPIESMIEANTLRLVRLNPMEQYPDEFLGLVRRAVEQEGFQVVMIDSLRSYELEMEQFGSSKAHIQNLVQYLLNQGCTSFLIGEVEYLTGAVPITELGVSHLADNILLLRYAEYEGAVIKILLCLKKRLGPAEPDLRQLRIGAAGFEVSEKLEHVRGILTGVAVPGGPA